MLMCALASTCTVQLTGNALWKVLHRRNLWICSVVPQHWAVLHLNHSLFNNKSVLYEQTSEKVAHADCFLSLLYTFMVESFRLVHISFIATRKLQSATLTTIRHKLTLRHLVAKFPGHGNVQDRRKRRSLGRYGVTTVAIKSCALPTLHCVWQCRATLHCGDFLLTFQTQIMKNHH